MSQPVGRTIVAVVEVGQANGPGYSTGEAVAGVIAEALYFPLSSLVVDRLLGRRKQV